MFIAHTKSEPNYKDEDHKARWLSELLVELRTEYLQYYEYVDRTGKDTHPIEAAKNRSAYIWTYSNLRSLAKEESNDIAKAFWEKDVAEDYPYYDHFWGLLGG